MPVKLRSICEGSGDVATLDSTFSGDRRLGDHVYPRSQGNTAECGWCHKTITVNLDGTLRRHADDGTSSKPKELPVTHEATVDPASEREREIVLAYQRGAAINELVQRYNLTGPPAVYAILTKSNVVAANGQSQPNPRDAKVVQDYLGGRNTTDIQTEYEISPGQLYRILDKAGVERRSKAEPDLNETPASIAANEALAKVELEPAQPVVSKGVALNHYRGRRVITVYEDFEVLAENFLLAAEMAKRENGELLSLTLAE